jgi:hypothetical protein
LAVEAFFVISGFYMALVLTERYDGHVGSFYRARALRIFPMYWALLALVVKIIRLSPAVMPVLCGVLCRYEGTKRLIHSTSMVSERPTLRGIFHSARFH